MDRSGCIRANRPHRRPRPTAHDHVTHHQSVEFATKLARLVERTAARHGGRAVKWLGDGVMPYY